MKRRRQFWRGGGGCGFSLFTSFVTCALLVLNSLVVTFAYTTLAPTASEFLRRPRVAQAILFAGPVVLLFIQWWLLDLLADLFSRRAETVREESKENETA